MKWPFEGEEEIDASMKTGRSCPLERYVAARALVPE